MQAVSNVGMSVPLHFVATDACNTYFSLKLSATQPSSCSLPQGTVKFTPCQSSCSILCPAHGNLQCAQYLILESARKSQVHAGRVKIVLICCVASSSEN